MSDLHSNVKMLTELVMDLDEDARQYKQGFRDGPGLEPDLIALEMLRQARRDLATIEHDIEQVLAKVMPEKIVVIEGAGTFERSKKTNRTQWDKEPLLSAILDSRLFDKHTGELREETPLEKVQMVFNLNPPRTTALRDRGIDPDQFCHTEDAGWSIRFQS